MTVPLVESVLTAGRSVEGVIKPDPASDERLHGSRPLEKIEIAGSGSSLETLLVGGRVADGFVVGRHVAVGFITDRLVPRLILHSEFEG